MDIFVTITLAAAIIGYSGLMLYKNFKSQLNGECGSCSGCIDKETCSSHMCIKNIER